MLSAISGLDSASDSSLFRALLDYDRDGWQDIALVNANEPLIELFHNDIAELPEADKRGMIAIRFVGGNTTLLRSALPTAMGMARSSKFRSPMAYD